MFYSFESQVEDREAAERAEREELRNYELRNREIGEMAAQEVRDMDAMDAESQIAMFGYALTAIARQERIENEVLEAKFAGDRF